MSWTDDRILEFWNSSETTEKLINAKAIDELIPIIDEEELETSGSETPTMDRDNLGSVMDRDSLGSENGNLVNQVETVDDDKLTVYPYHSVGRLYWWHKNIENEEPIIWATAFYIGHNQIMTVAHVFDCEDLRNKYGAFIPAMKSRREVRNLLYGAFQVDPKKRYCHPQYRKYQKYDRNEVVRLNTPQYDICKLDVSEKFNDSNAMLDDANLEPIKYKVDQVYNNETAWTVLGYPRDGGKLTEYKGWWKQERSNERVTAINYKIPKGVSGGPWILGHEIAGQRPAVATGCQATHHSSGYSTSPYFCETSTTCLVEERTLLGWKSTDISLILVAKYNIWF